MGDVLGGIGRGLLDILGGAHALKRQQTEGYDWREKQAQAEWQRQRERELAAQQDEENQRKKEAALTSELSDIIAGAGEGDQPDLESMLPASIDYQRKKALIARAMGAGKERKSALQAQKVQADLARRQSQDAAAMEREKFKADQREELMREAENIRQNQTMSPREKEIQLGQLNNALTVLERRSTMGGASGGKVTYTKVPTVRNGVAGTLLISNTGEERFEPAATTAATRGKEESKGAAMGAFNELMDIYDSMGGQPEGGLTARITGLTRRGQAATGYNPEARTYTGGVRGFVPLMARALGHVGVLTELDVQRTEELFPRPGDTAEEAAQKRRLLTEIMSGRRPLPFQFENQDGQAPQHPAGSGERMVKYKGQLVPLSSLPPELQKLVR